MLIYQFQEGCGKVLTRHHICQHQPCGKQWQSSPACVVLPKDESCLVHIIQGGVDVLHQYAISVSLALIPPNTPLSCAVLAKSRFSRMRTTRAPTFSSMSGSSFTGLQRSVPGMRPYKISPSRSSEVAIAHKNLHPCLRGTTNYEEQWNNQADYYANFDIIENGKEKRQCHQTKINPCSHPDMKISFINCSLRGLFDNEPPIIDNVRGCLRK